MSRRVVDVDGTIRYFNEHGQLHREDGPAIDHADGTREWYVDGKIHRTDGPAIERASGTRSWWVNGRRHRTDGPAIEWTDGTFGWYLYDERITFSEWLNRINISEEERTLLMIQYSDIREL